MKHAVLAGIMVCGQAFAQPCERWQSNNPGTLPSGRWTCAMAHHAANETTVLFGGQLLADYAEMNDTWTFDGAQWRQVNVAGPSRRAGAMMAYDAARGRTVLFGGSAGTTVGPYYRDFYQDTWEWDGSTWQRVATTGPTPRMGAAMAYDPVAGRVVLAGGLTYNGSWTALSDCWEWNGSVWTQTASLPAATGNAPMAFDETSQRLVLFSGSCGQYCGFNSQTFERVGAAWMISGASGPIARANHMMAYSPELGGTVLFGGTYGNPSGEMNDTWLYREGTWRLMQTGGTPPRREAGVMVHDASRHRLMVFGGGLVSPATLLQDQWELAFGTPVITVQPVDQAVAADVPVAFVVTATSTTGCAHALTYRWQRRNQSVADPDAPGAWIDLVDGGGYANANGAVFTVLRAAPGFTGPFRCAVTDPCGCSTYSTSADFSVACPADFNADGGVDFGDVQAFFDRWENGC